jgi:hypothetical protein
MAVAILFDVHVDYAIAGQLRLRNVDVLTAKEIGADRMPDELLLSRASESGRLLFTHDIHLQAMAENWQLHGKPFGGLVFGHLMQISIGQCVNDLELIAKATDPPDWISAIIRLPL